jgi:hypothetical protein
VETPVPDCLSRHADPLVAAASLEAHSALRERIAQISAEMNSRGILHSSIFVNAVAKACAAELHELTAIAWDCTRRGFEACGGEGQNELAPYFLRTIAREAERTENVLQGAVGAVATGLLNKSMIPLTEVQEAREHLSAKYETEAAVYLAEAQRRTETRLANHEKASVSSWPIQAAWFAAGILGTGAFWYFLSQKDSLLTWLSGLGTLGFFGVAVWLHVKADASPT